MISLSRKTVLRTLLILGSASTLCLGQMRQDKPDQISAHSRLAERYLQEQRPELAIPELQKVVALDPDNVDARGNLGVLLYFRRDYKDAVPQLRVAVRLRPDLWKLRALLGLGEARLADPIASRSDLENAFPPSDSSPSSSRKRSYQQT